MNHILYDCEICGALHPWNFDGDCRDDRNRYNDPSEYAKKYRVKVNAIEIRSMDERLDADD